MFFFFFFPVALKLGFHLFVASNALIEERFIKKPTRPQPTPLRNKSFIAGLIKHGY